MTFVTEVVGTRTLEARVATTVVPQFSERTLDVIVDLESQASRGNLSVQLGDDALRQLVAIVQVCTLSVYEHAHISAFLRVGQPVRVKLGGDTVTESLSAVPITATPKTSALATIVALLELHSISRKASPPTRLRPTLSAT